MADKIEDGDDTAGSRAAAQQSAMDSSADGGPSLPRAQLDRDFLHGDVLFRGSQCRRYRRLDGDPLYRPLRIYSSDPMRSRYEGAEMVVSVPYEALEKRPDAPDQALPAGSMVEVVEDVDPLEGTPLFPLVDLDDRALLLTQGLPPSASDPRFHQQMVYAVAMDVVAQFETALGREPCWGFNPSAEGRRLRLRPHGGDDQNAYYSKAKGEIAFGQFAATHDAGGQVLPGGTIYTCLSQDIIAHEMAHALLDGMRARFDEDTNPDVLAFHEAFADLVAVLHHFSHAESVQREIAKGQGTLTGGKGIFTIARQFGAATGRPGPLRVLLTEGGGTRFYGTTEEPHELGAVLVEAVLDAFNTIFERRVAQLRTIYGLSVLEGRALHPAFVDLLADEAARVGGQFLFLCIRAIDYCPPIDITFGEYLRALVTADRDLVENDPWGYRESLIAAFGRKRIFPPNVTDLSEDALLWRKPRIDLPKVVDLSLRKLQLGDDPALAPETAEVRRQAQALADLICVPEYAREFGIARVGPGENEARNPPVIESIRTIRRVGPDRQVRFGLVAEVLQNYDERRHPGRWGGSTIILGGSGEVRYVIGRSPPKPDAKRWKRAGSVARNLTADRNEPWKALHSLEPAASSAPKGS